MIRKLNEKGTKVKIVKEGESPARKAKKPKKVQGTADKENASVDPEVLKQQEKIVIEKQ